MMMINNQELSRECSPSQAGHLCLHDIIFPDSVQNVMIHNEMPYQNGQKQDCW